MKNLLLLLLISPIFCASQDIKEISKQQLLLFRPGHTNQLLFVSHYPKYFANYIHFSNDNNVYHGVAFEDLIFVRKFDAHGKLVGEYKVKNGRLKYHFKQIDSQMDSLYRYFLVKHKKGLPQRITYFNKDLEVTVGFKFPDSRYSLSHLENLFLYEEFVVWALQKGTPPNKPIEILPAAPH